MLITDLFSIIQGEAVPFRSGQGRLPIFLAGLGSLVAVKLMKQCLTVLPTQEICHTTKRYKPGFRSVNTVKI